MADNYLEKRYEEVFSSGSKAPAHRRGGVSVESLMKRTRTCRKYDTTYEVMQAQLEAIVRVNRYVPSARNCQQLRFRLLTRRSGSEKMQGLYRLSSAIPPRETAPDAFIVVCAAQESRYVDIDLGISCQSMALKASEMGLSSVIVASFDKEAVKQALGLELEPLIIMAFGKGVEKIEIVDAGEDLRYYEKDGVHCVPKLSLEDIII